MQSDFDKDLLAYFTDVEHLRALFKEYVTAQTLPKRILVIHGVGGVGKSSLLRMFRLHCKSVNVPVALVSGDEAKSALDVLARWTDDLKADGIAFASFGKTFEHYRAIQAKVDEQAKKAQDARGRAADIAGKAATKTAEVAGGALAGAAIGSVIPGIGTAIGGALGGVLGGMGAEALVDWLRGFVTKPDIDLLLDPAKKLTDDFITDVAQATAKRRIVLMLDTFEQMTALDDWARDVAQRLHANVLLVIAGRALPNWSRAWQSWMANAHVEELRPMTEDVMHNLVRRYYATMRGGEPNPAQVEQIIRFARGLPMVVASAVRLWVAYGVEDFQSVKPLIVADLVDRLMEGVPSELIPALEAAAVVRWFDQPILRAVMKQDDVREVYNELWRFPFVRTRAEGLTLHDAVREIMNENLRVQDSERHSELHVRAAADFEKRLEKATDEEGERLGLERLYHRVRADEEAGIKLFQEMAEELVRYRLISRLRALLNDVNTYTLERENSKLWREYYIARIGHFEMRLADAEKVYLAIGENQHAESKLRAYAFCDLGASLASRERIGKPGGTEKALSLIERSLKAAPNTDAKIISNLITKCEIYMLRGNWTEASRSLKPAAKFYMERHDAFGVATIYDRQKAVFAFQGNWKNMFHARQQGLDAIPATSGHSYLYAELVGGWMQVWALAGFYAEAERNERESLAVLQQLGDSDTQNRFLELGTILTLEGKYQEGEKFFRKLLTLFPSVKSTTAYRWLGVAALRSGEIEKATEILTACLALLKRISYMTPA